MSSSTIDPLPGWLRVEGDRAVLTLVGEVDLATVRLLRTYLEDAVGAGASQVVVDLAAVEFMDATGLTVLVSMADRLRAGGGALTVRAVPASIYHLFEITGVVEALGAPRPSAARPLARELAGFASGASSRAVLDAALKLVVTMAQAVVEGADGVSITLPRHGRLGTVAASNDVVLEMDHDQYDTGEGPCLDAATQGQQFHVDSLAAEDRWPTFVPRAKARGIESILSAPLIAGTEPIGALNLYSRTVGAFAVPEKLRAAHFAKEAAVVVGSAREGLALVLHAQIQQALTDREVIAQAEGVVMHRDEMSPSAARAALVGVSRRTGRPLRDLCSDLVSEQGVPTATVGSGGVDRG